MGWYYDIFGKSALPDKKLVVGTRHYTEKRITPEIRVAMELIVDKSSPAIGLEEWSIDQVERSGFDVVCESKKVL
jgi:hypothetical protein